MSRSSCCNQRPSYPDLLRAFPIRFHHNGSKSSDSLPLRNCIFPGTPATALLCGIPSSSSYHNGSKTRDSLPLRNSIFLATPATALLGDIPASFPYHNGSISCDSLPLRQAPLYPFFLYGRARHLHTCASVALKFSISHFAVSFFSSSVRCQ